MKVEIEKMSVDDLQSIDLNKFDDFWNENMLREELSSPSSFYIIAKLQDNIVGFAGINLILDEAHLANIVVKKEMRGKKIGSKLLESLLEKARKVATSIILEVSTENVVALHLYKKYGFHQVGKRKKYYNHQFDANIMIKELK